MKRRDGVGQIQKCRGGRREEARGRREEDNGREVEGRRKRRLEK